jgi:hypothetical protein
MFSAVVPARKTKAVFCPVAGQHPRWLSDEQAVTRVQRAPVKLGQPTTCPPERQSLADWVKDAPRPHRRVKTMRSLVMEDTCAGATRHSSASAPRAPYPISGATSLRPFGSEPGVHPALLLRSSRERHAARQHGSAGSPCLHDLNQVLHPGDGRYRLERVADDRDPILWARRRESYPVSDAQAGLFASGTSGVAVPFIVVLVLRCGRQPAHLQGQELVLLDDALSRWAKGRATSLVSCVGTSLCRAANAARNTWPQGGPPASMAEAIAC